MISMESIFTFTTKIYQALSATSVMLFEWFGEPIDSSLAEFIGLPTSTTNIELVFGSFLIVALVGSVRKLFSFLG